MEYFIVRTEDDHESAGFQVPHWSEQEEGGPDTALNHEEAATIWAQKHLSLTGSVWARVVVEDSEGEVRQFTVSIRVQLCYDVEEQ